MDKWLLGADEQPQEILPLQGWWGTGWARVWGWVGQWGQPWGPLSTARNAPFIQGYSLKSPSTTSHGCKITPRDLCQSCWFTSSWWGLICLQNTLPGQQAIAHQNNWAPLRLKGPDACWRWGMSRVRSSLCRAWSWQERTTRDTPTQLHAPQVCSLPRGGCISCLSTSSPNMLWRLPVSVCTGMNSPKPIPPTSENSVFKREGGRGKIISAFLI